MQALWPSLTKADGKFIDVNEVFLETLGYSRDEVIGKFTNDLGLFVNPDDRVKALRILEERGVVRGMEAGIRVKDGSCGPACSPRI